VLAQPHRRRRPVREAHHRVFPVSHVVAEDLPVHRVPLVEGVEVHVEGVHDAVMAVVVGHDDGA